MDTYTQAGLDNYYQGNQILGIPDIGYFAEPEKNVVSARQRLSQRKN
ncbi:MAG: hypothetical protein M3P28_03820 [Thermoproteota archaeon]|nr:hypothetical protein [Thermoproteota archaeon]